MWAYAQISIRLIIQHVTLSERQSKQMDRRNFIVFCSRPRRSGFSTLTTRRRFGQTGSGGLRDILCARTETWSRTPARAAAAAAAHRAFVVDELSTHVVKVELLFFVTYVHHGPMPPLSPPHHHPYVSFINSGGDNSRNLCSLEVGDSVGDAVGEGGGNVRQGDELGTAISSSSSSAAAVAAPTTTGREGEDDALVSRRSTTAISGENLPVTIATPAADGGRSDLSTNMPWLTGVAHEAERRSSLADDDGETTRRKGAAGSVNASIDSNDSTRPIQVLKAKQRSTSPRTAGRQAARDLATDDDDSSSIESLVPISPPRLQSGRRTCTSQMGTADGGRPQDRHGAVESVSSTTGA